MAKEAAGAGTGTGTSRLLSRGGGGPAGGWADRKEEGESLRGGGRGRGESPDLAGGARRGPARSAVFGPSDTRLK